MRLKELRLSKGYSQSDLAKVLGVTYQAISHWEKGRRELPVNVAKKLGKLLDVDWWLLYED